MVIGLWWRAALQDRVYLIYNFWALAPAAPMQLAPQEIRTLFVTSVTDGRKAILQSHRMAGLLIDVMQQNRRRHRR